MPDRILIFDTTLRDGEQAPGISLNREEKVEIAEQLARLGVDIVEAGFPISSEGDFQSVSSIAERVRGPVIAGLARSLEPDIDRCWEAVRHADKPRIHVFLSTSPIHIKHKLQMTEDEVLHHIAHGVARAKSYCDDIEFSPEDATRTDWEYLFTALQLAVDNGATTLNIPDTVGYATPDEFYDMIRGVFENVRMPDTTIISTHCHNDLGLATANSLAGVRAGARQVEGAVNGIGERAGNTSTEEVIMALDTRGDQFLFKSLAHTHEISRTSRLVARLTGYPVQYNKAIVGRNAFSHESGIHQHGVLMERSTYEIMDPKSVGQEGSKIVLGKHSGRHAFADALEKMGIEVTKEELERAFRRFKELADRKVEITDAGLEAIVAAEIGTLEDTYELVALDVAGGTDRTPYARVVIGEKGGQVKTAAAEGDGLIDAAVKALKEATKHTDARLVDYKVGATTGGSDSLGEVTMQVMFGEHLVTGQGLSTDVVEASARAFVSALNRAQRVENLMKLRDAEGVVGP